MINLIIFDLDGVLVDSKQWHYEALNMALTEVEGTFISEKEQEAKFEGLPTYKKLQILINENRVNPINVEKIQKLKQEATKDLILSLTEVDDSKVFMFNNLKKFNILIGCYTNCIRETAQLMLEKSGQLKFIDHLVTNQDVANPKPNPEGYLKIMNTYSISTDNTLIIEDSIVGIAAAKATGAYVLEVENATKVNWELIRKYVN